MAAFIFGMALAMILGGAALAMILGGVVQDRRDDKIAAWLLSGLASAEEREGDI